MFGVKVANVRIQPIKNRIEPVDYGDLRPNPIGGVKLNTLSFSVPTNTMIIHIDTFFFKA